MDNSLLWQPSSSRVEDSNMQAFIGFLNQHENAGITDYPSLHNWSLQNNATFWVRFWQWTQIQGDPGDIALSPDMENRNRDSVWFPEARLNYAENLLHFVPLRNQEDALIFCDESGQHRHVSWHQLYDQVASIAQFLREKGIQQGDVIAGYLPNMPETIVAMLAATSLGAIWTSTSPDFGVDSVLDRFGQTEPKVLFTVDGYFYGGRTHDCMEKSHTIVERLPSVEQWIVVSHAGRGFGLPDNAIAWQDLMLENPPPPEFVPVSFNSPLFILYSSGTTGKPKCIVHRVGGILINHLKEHILHSDIKAGDTVFYFTTCGWMMWNWLVSGLASGATLLLYDGSPFHPEPGILWQLAERYKVSLFGTSAKYLEALAKQGYWPEEHHDLSSLRTICSTGSVLAPEQFDFVYDKIKQDVQLSSISGGTDICGCFVLGSPMSQVHRSECQVKGLGMDVRVVNSDGHAVTGEQGELVCCNTFPNQPLGFWNDPDSEKYNAAYWERFPGIWHHGDYVEERPTGGLTFYGRSDAVLNPGGVRIGTAEVYRYVNTLPEVADSVVIGQTWDNDVRVVLFVQLKDKEILTPDLEDRIRKTLRQHCSPHHVPSKILAVQDIPRTRSGKLAELAVKDVVHGRDVVQQSALANPGSLAEYENREELRD